jgi:thiol-disulfide isomerase/thioredoxin
MMLKSRRRPGPDAGRPRFDRERLGTVASSANDEPRKGTPVPPRGAKRGPSRPGTNRGTGANRAAVNRRTAVARQRQQRQTVIAIAAIGVVIVVIAVFVVIKVAGGGSGTKTASGGAAGGSTTSGTLSPALYQQLTSPAAATLAAAAKNYKASALTYPTVAKDPAITTTGKPEILYIGAEYCPYCATERWPLVLALSKFGTFTNLGEIHSSSTDVYPSTPTVSFYKSSYTSPYLTFVPVETETVSEKPLQAPTAAQQAIIDRYDSGQNIPFVYLNGKSIISGAEYNPQLLAGKTQAEVISSIAGGTSALADNIYANAGAIISDICHMTGGKPGNVCSEFPTPITS